MSWIRTVNDGDATGRLKEIYDSVKKRRGKLSNIMRVQSLHPEAMEAHLNLYMAVMFGRSGLSREDRELIALVVSAANGCPYCIRHHAEALMHYWADEERVQQFVDNPGSVELSPLRRCMVDYARMLTLQPDRVNERTVEKLREQGQSDEDILTLALIVGYFNFVNRIALGLGVSVTENEAFGYQY